MKAAKLLPFLIFCAAITLTSAPAFSAPYGMYDREHVWRNSVYWHSHYPDWFYRYHPEWAVDHRDWWQFDHEAHPEWFRTRFWDSHPIWRYGAYDQYHQWHYADWWHERNPGWIYAHHPEWAEPYPRWMRADYGTHPEWFHSPYWRDHPHDWTHPDEIYRREHEIDRATAQREYERNHGYAAGVKYQDHGWNGSAHAGSVSYGSEPHNAASIYKTRAIRRAVNRLAVPKITP